MMRNPTDPNTKVSMQKISAAFWEYLKIIDWQVELRFFMIAGIADSTLFLILYFGIRFYFNNYYYGIFGIFFYLGTLAVAISIHWIGGTSFTTHESRKKNIGDIRWCLQGYIEDHQPSILRQNLLMKHKLNIREFFLLSMVQRLHVIFGALIGTTIFIIFILLEAPHLGQHSFLYAPRGMSCPCIFCQYLGLYSLYIIGGIIAVIFSTWGYLSDMRLHITSIVPGIKKSLLKYTLFLLKYTFFAFLFSLVITTVLYSTAFFIMKLYLT